MTHTVTHWLAGWLFGCESTHVLKRGLLNNAKCVVQAIGHLKTDLTDESNDLLKFAFTVVKLEESTLAIIRRS